MRKSLKETAASFTELLILELKRQSNQLSLSLTRSLNYFFFLFLFFSLCSSSTSGGGELQTLSALITAVLMEILPQIRASRKVTAVARSPQGVHGKINPPDKTSRLSRERFYWGVMGLLP